MSSEKDKIELELRVLHTLVGKEDAMPEVPEGYFEQLEQDILNRTVFGGLSNPPARIIRRHWWKTITAVAAMAAIVFIEIGRAHV